eukprot:5999122-Amphidinium_carterae.1
MCCQGENGQNEACMHCSSQQGKAGEVTCGLCGQTVAASCPGVTLEGPMLHGPSKTPTCFENACRTSRKRKRKNSAKKMTSEVRTGRCCVKPVHARGSCVH